MQPKQIIIDYEQYLDMKEIIDILGKLYWHGITEELKEEIEKLNIKYGWWV